MRVVVTSQGLGLDSQVDPCLGRARYLVCVDTDTGDFTSHNNFENSGAVLAAGIGTARNITTDLGVKAVITGNIGPRALAALEGTGVRVYTGATGSVRHAVEEFKAGKLPCAIKANTEGHYLDVE